MRNSCFVDSAGWIALLNADDELHQKTDAIYKEQLLAGTMFITSTAVLNEVANSLCKPMYRDAVIEFYKRLQNSLRIKTVFVDKSLWSQGWKLFEDRPDKSWSLTDCISMEIMSKYKLRDVLTNDIHFSQAGYNALLREK
ncbi:MAG: PIN domain-containing protein [candidate division KSB1 bacterium]|nr:PIN domain-containing protein [candidate division KSB1 bacterium]MDZ7401332.1 PIN domain-containing protein [candidate division KSB1 bacterium]